LIGNDLKGGLRRASSGNVHRRRRQSLKLVLLPFPRQVSVTRRWVFKSNSLGLSLLQQNQQRERKIGVDEASDAETQKLIYIWR
jgi:hypothetical protein